VRRVKQNPFLACSPFTRRQLTRPPKWLLSATEEHLQPRNRKTITWAVKPHVARTMPVSLNCEHRYPVRISTKKISRGHIPFHWITFGFQKVQWTRTILHLLSSPLNSSFQVFLQLARTDTLNHAKRFNATNTRLIQMGLKIFLSIHRTFSVEWNKMAIRSEQERISNK